MGSSEGSSIGSREGGLFPVRVVKRFLDAQGPNWATLIAWNGLFAMFPMVLITVTIIGAVLNSPSLSHGIEQQVVAAFPSKSSQQQILNALHDFKQKSGLLGIIGFLGLMWSGSSLFGAIEQGLTALYPCKPRDFIHQKLVAFGMILLFTVLAVPLVLSGSLLPALRSLPVVPSALTTGPAALLIQVGAGVLDAAILFFAIYFVVPHRRQRVRDVIPGAITAGILLEALTLIFPVYFKLAGGFATYGATFALFFLMMTFAFFLGIITMIGGAVNAELVQNRSEGKTIDMQRVEGTEPAAPAAVMGRRDEEARRAGAAGPGAQPAPQQVRARRR